VKARVNCNIYHIVSELLGILKRQSHIWVISKGVYCIGKSSYPPITFGTLSRVN